MEKCIYLGHVVGNGEVRPEESKLHAVENFPTPTTKKQVCAFLCLTGAEYADVAVALTDLTRKNAPNRVKWTTLCEKAFKALKDRLCSSPILKSPDFDRKFILQTDASNRGVGAVLSQQDSDGVEHPEAFYSRKLLPREEHYSVIEKECLAIKLATHAFRVYLLGRPFEIRTDHLFNHVPVTSHLYPVCVVYKELASYSCDLSTKRYILNTSSLPRDPPQLYYNTVPILSILKVTFYSSLIQLMSFANFFCEGWCSSC